MRRASLITLHGALVIILTGALLTHLFSVSGIVHLREGLSTNSILTQGENGPSIRQIPFTITLDTFQIAYHEGTASAADYISSLTITHAHEAVIYIVNETSFNGFDKDPVREGKPYKQLAAQRIERVAAMPYADVLDRHARDYKKYFDRVQEETGYQLG